VRVTVLKGLYLGLFPYCKGAVKESCTYFIDLFGCHVEFLGDLVEAHALVKTTKDIRFKAAHFHEGIVLGIKCCARGNIGRVKDPAIPQCDPKTVSLVGLMHLIETDKGRSID
jgi:hypothetical protein